MSREKDKQYETYDGRQEVLPYKSKPNTGKFGNQPFVNSANIKVEGEDDEISSSNDFGNMDENYNVQDENDDSHLPLPSLEGIKSLGI